MDSGLQRELFTFSFDLQNADAGEADEGAKNMETRTTFQKYLHELEEDVVTMGDMVEKAIYRSIEALQKRDLALAHQIIADDAQINKQRFSIEDK